MDNYVKLFDLSWIQPWLAESLVMILGALLLVFLICKAMDCFNGDNQ
jgi:hypothetical protein